MGDKRRMRKLYALFAGQFGIDPWKAAKSLSGLPRYLRDLFRFRALYTGRLELLPFLNDRSQEAGATRSEYFWQDLLVARSIFIAKPDRHVDIGSRVDGFVAHVASFREIEVFDIRPISVPIPGVVFKQADITKPLAEMNGYCDSLSCLHALEHFGLGRYGDNVDPGSYCLGLENMARLLREAGVLYLSVPIGLERVEFNGHRIFDPRTIIELCAGNALRLTALTVIGRNGDIHSAIAGGSELAELAAQRYTLGLFTFRKAGGVLGPGTSHGRE